MRLDRTDPRKTRARLLAGATALAFTALALPAFADEDGAIATALPAMSAAPEQAAPLADDGLGETGYLLESDTLIQDDTGGTITAEGEVQIRNQGRTLRADRVVYNRTTGVVVATGNVVVVDQDGTTAFANEMVLDDQFRAGVAKGFSARLQNNIKIAGDTLVRRDDNTAELNKGIYTPCELCEEDKTKDPTWSIKAEKVVQDGEKHLIYYENAVIEMFGVPVFYTPILWHADPGADRMSGLLPPTIVASQRRGLSYEQPYLWVINPYADLTVTPQVNTKVNPFVNFDYRQRFYSGEIEARFGYTYSKDLDSNGSKIGDATHRSYVLANGAFEIDENWKWGFAAERASDDLIFDKYDISDVSRQRGLVSSDNRRLTSQLFATRQDNLSWFSVNAISVQGLRPTDNDRTFPTIAPLIEGRFELPMPVLGGRFRMQGSAVVLTREQSQFVASQPGADSRRATFQADWRTSVTFDSGLRISPFVEARGDYYSIEDYPAAGGSASFGRALGVIGFDLTYPLFRRDGDRTIVLEPIAQIAVSPDSDLDPRLPNSLNGGEDSVVLEFDETNLFRANKSPGFDLYEGGLRLNVGGRATISFDDGRSFSLLVGRSLRDTDDTVLPARSGLQPKASDWILAGDAKPFQNLTLYGRARLDSETLDLRRLEIGVNATFERANGYVRYLHDNQDITGVERQDIDFAADVMVTKTFGITTAGVWDIENDVWRRQELGAFYRDDCLDLAIVWIHEETFNRSLGPSDSVVLRLTLATLGDKGYRR